MESDMFFFVHDLLDLVVVDDLFEDDQDRVQDPQVSQQARVVAGAEGAVGALEARGHTARMPHVRVQTTLVLVRARAVGANEIQTPRFPPGSSRTTRGHCKNRQIVQSINY